MIWKHTWVIFSIWLITSLNELEMSYTSLIYRAVNILLKFVIQNVSLYCVIFCDIVISINIWLSLLAWPIRTIRYYIWFKLTLINMMWIVISIKFDEILSVWYTGTFQYFIYCNWCINFWLSMLFHASYYTW